MRTATTTSLLALALVLGAGACSSDDSGSDDGGGTDGTTTVIEADAGSAEGLDAIQATVASGLESDLGAVDVECPPEIAEGPGVYECVVTVAEDGSTGVVTVSTEGGSFDLQGYVPD